MAITTAPFPLLTEVARYELATLRDARSLERQTALGAKHVPRYHKVVERTGNRIMHMNSFPPKSKWAVLTHYWELNGTVDKLQRRQTALMLSEIQLNHLVGQRKTFNAVPSKFALSATVSSLPVAGALYTTFEARGILNDYITRDYQTDNPYEAMLMAQEEESLKPINQKIAMHKSEREMALQGLRGELPVAIRTYCSDCSNSSSSRCPLPGIVPEL